MIHNPTEVMARTIRELRAERIELKAQIALLHGRIGGMTKALRVAEESAEEWACQCDGLVIEVRRLREALRG